MIFQVNQVLPLLTAGTGHQRGRYIAKSINFGLSYDMGAGGLQANLKENGIDIELLHHCT
jgi:DNA polymerase I-like protein with 3'-5' exonuclease and polymerase domains